MMNTKIDFVVNRCKCSIDLAEICKDSYELVLGQKVHLFYPVNKAKKLFKVMIQNIYDEEQLFQIGEFLKKANKRLYKVWEEEYTRWKTSK